MVHWRKSHALSSEPVYWKRSILGPLPPLPLPLPQKCSYFTSSYPTHLFGSGRYSQPLPLPLPKHCMHDRFFLYLRLLDCPRLLIHRFFCFGIQFTQVSFHVVCCQASLYLYNEEQLSEIKSHGHFNDGFIGFFLEFQYSRFPF